MEKGKKGGEEREAVQEKAVAELEEPSPFQGCDLQCLFHMSGQLCPCRDGSCS